MGSKSRELHLQLDIRFIHNPSISHKASKEHAKKIYIEEKGEKNLHQTESKTLPKAFSDSLTRFFDVLMKSYLRESFFFLLQYARLNYRFSQSRHYSQQSSFKISEAPKKKRYFPWRPQKFFFSFSFFFMLITDKKKETFRLETLWEFFAKLRFSFFLPVFKHAIDGSQKKRIESSARPSRLNSGRD